MKPLLVTFKAKPEKIWYGEIPRLRVKVPALARSHCDMNAMRSSRRFGGYANSDLFAALLARAVAAIVPSGKIWADEPLPAGVTLDTSGFLWRVTVALPES